MEHGEDHQAAPDNIFAPTRAYAKVVHDYFGLNKHLNLAAFSCLMQIVRVTAGYQRPTHVVPVSYLEAETGLSHNGVLQALRELTQKQIISIEVTGRGRAQKSEITIRSQAEWLIPCHATNNGALSEPIIFDENGAPSEPITSNGALSEPILQINGQLSRPITANIGSVSEPIASRTSIERKREKKTPSHDGARPTRKITLEDEAYRKALLEAVKPFRGSDLPKHGAEWAAAGRLFKAGAPVETMVALWQTEMRRPKWDSNPLSLAILVSLYGRFKDDREKYTAAVERSIKAANGHYDGPRGAAPVTSHRQTMREVDLNQHL